MIAPVPPASPVSDEQIVRTYAVITITFCAALMVVGALGAFVDGSDVGPLLVAVPIAIAAIVVNVSGPGAVRRHLARLRA